MSLNQLWFNCNFTPFSAKLRHEYVWIATLIYFDSICFVLTLFAPSKEEPELLFFLGEFYLEKQTVHRADADASNVPPAKQRDWIKSRK